MDNSPLNKTDTEKTQSTSTLSPRFDGASKAATSDSNPEHFAKHIIVKPPQWQSFNNVPLQPIDSRYYTQVHVESLFFSIMSFIAATVITLFAAQLNLSNVLLLLAALLMLQCSIGYIRYQQAKQLGYATGEHEFLMQQGLWWHKRTSLPYSRLQHVSLSQGPLERHFNLVTLKCFSAGSGSAEIELPGIKQRTAEHLRQHLLGQAGKAHVAAPKASDNEQHASDTANAEIATAKNGEADHDQ
ncbi:PH domain-containing protein [Shewanella youngdeokensis]|uniref:PH domain-containing protein n=1 Tax=Shewanella youngdeokensis TaxID=2999068 RepID=A0ABZ0K002_9GAMM|nr:PH domain-containing protein [Shewanella sp. DAU334]